jgi:hypothetical protein
VHQLEHYTVIPDDEKKLYSYKSTVLVDPAKRREVKVKQYKKSKEIKDRIQVRVLSFTFPASTLSQVDVERQYSHLRSFKNA